MLYRPLYSVMIVIRFSARVLQRMDLEDYGSPFVYSLVQFRLTSRSLRRSYLDGLVSAGGDGFVLTAGYGYGIVGGLLTIGYLKGSFCDRGFVAGLAIQARISMEVFATKESSLVGLSFLRNALSKDNLFKLKDIHARSKGGFLRLFSLFFFLLIYFFRLASRRLT